MPLSDVGSIATRQGGVISRPQLLRLGVSVQAIKTAVRAGRLTPVHRGVYAVGHLALADHGRAKAALLAAGPHAVASHRTAAALWTLTPSMPAVQDVTLLRGDRRKRPNLNVHHTNTPLEVRHRNGLPLTAPLRTLADLGFPRDLTREALAKRLVRPEDLAASARTRSNLERRFLGLVRRAGLPVPEVNHRVGRTRWIAWPELGLVVETDGWATHGHRAAFEADRERDAYLIARGLAVLRVTDRRLRREPLRVVAELAQAAAVRAPRASNSSVYGWSVASATGS